MKYNAEELAIIFECYQEIMTEINKKQVFQPTIKNFCSFCGISSALYHQWQKDVDNADRREVMQQIDDYITDVSLSLAQQGKIREITTLFRSKSEHGMVEAAAPITYKVQKEVDMDKIKAQLSVINSGKSLKNVELVKGKDGVYHVDEGGKDDE